MVVSETRNGVESDYVSDTLGSTIGLLDSAGTMTDRWEYWPYGEVVSRSGTSVTPLTFLGILGYFQDVLSKLFYVRARHLKVDLARWLTADPIWPLQSAYAYCSQSPLSLSDPSGLEAGQCWVEFLNCNQQYLKAYTTCFKVANDNYNSCLENCDADPICGVLCGVTVQQQYKICHKTGNKAYEKCERAYTLCLMRRDH